MPPRIGVSMNYHLSADGVERAYLDTPYFEFILAHGGVPCPILPTDQVDSLPSVLDSLDAVLFTGGLDLDPALWNEPIHPRTRLLHPRRQRFELALYRHATERKLPILMICLGIQLLNVAHGGGLCQHLPDRRSPIDHGGDGRLTRHPITLHPDSRLAERLNTGQIEVNSTHHQGIIDPAPGLFVAASAADGAVEALERPDYPFLLAVQWHPEKEPVSPVSTVVMAAFLTAARGRST